jgi:uncharacterized protein (TIGR02145 family)
MKIKVCPNSIRMVLVFLFMVTACKKEEKALVPVLMSADVTGITQNTAMSGGNITSDNGFLVIARGVCWSTGTTPSIIDSKTTDGAGAGSFTSEITGLNISTTYYVRAYATNSQGTSYGSTMSFTTKAGLVPILTTSLVSNIKENSASSGGNISSDGGTPVIARGICWSTSANPLITGSHTTDGTGIGTYSSLFGGLTVYTTYYVRAYATNIIGTSYGNELSFRTYPLTVSDVEGNIYNVLKIGTQLWMKENLKATKYQNGSLIGTTNPSTLDISTQFNPKYQWAYDGSDAMASAYGRLYTWYAATDSRNVCPIGWRIPSKDDWTKLITFIGGESDAAIKLKAYAWTDDPYQPTDEFGFSAKPGGSRWPSIGFQDYSKAGYWWSSTPYTVGTEYTVGNSIILYINQVYTWARVNALAGNNMNHFGFSVRCVRDY